MLLKEITKGLKEFRHRNKVIQALIKLQVQKRISFKTINKI